jgi:hypothetical protein
MPVNFGAAVKWELFIVSIGISNKHLDVLSGLSVPPQCGKEACDKLDFDVNPVLSAECLCCCIRGGPAGFILQLIPVSSASGTVSQSCLEQWARFVTELLKHLWGAL